MTSDQFDRMAARMAEYRATRRATIGALSAGVAAVTLGARATKAQDGTPVAGDTLETVHSGAVPAPPEFLFVQSFASVSLVPLDAAEGGLR